MSPRSCQGSKFETVSNKLTIWKLPVKNIPDQVYQLADNMLSVSAN